MEGTAFNYSCKPLNPNPKCHTDLRIPEMRTAIGLQVLQQCSMLVKIHAEIYNLKVQFCENVTLVHNTESNTIGIKIMGQSCMVRIQEGKLTQNLWIFEGSYRFFRQLSYIACSHAGIDLYTDCSDSELFLINALDMGYDEEVELTIESGSVGSEGFTIDTSGFANLLGSQSKNLFVIIGVVIGVIIIATIIIIIICLCCNYCPKRAVVE
jgi:hypothetical protein